MGPGARRDFCERLLRFTLTQAADVTRRDNIRLLTADAAAAEVARSYSISSLPDPGRGLNDALEHGRQAMLSQAHWMDALLIWPIDLPFVSPDAIGDMASRPADLVISPDNHGTGTNMLLLRSRAVPTFRFAFGLGSYHQHLDIARDMQISVASYEDWRLGFDVDTPGEYLHWLKHPSAAGQVGQLCHR
jgi:2-phospho-L-lactate guanylyltransferase